MAVPYVVRKKADLTSGERKELWYGVPKKLIDPIRNREFAEYMEKRSGFHRGQIDGILTEMVDAIRSLLSIGQPVTIEGLIFYGNVVLPFVDHFPKDTELYRIMTTKPEEVSSL